MKKLIIKIIILFFFHFSFGLAEVIKDIKISGNKRITDESILVLGDISKNKDFNEKNLNTSLKKLYDTNFFSNIELTINQGVLNILITENPIIEKIEILGIKNKNFLKTIEENIILKDRMSFTENQLKRDVIFISIIL